MYCDWPVLGRCCFCLPLRRGILVFGYINILFCAFIIGIYSYAVHQTMKSALLYHGPNAVMAPPELCVALYCLELVFNAMLIYGTHAKSTSFIKAFYYFAISTTLVGVVLQCIELFSSPSLGGILFEMIPLMLTGLCINIYLIILVSSLLRKLQMDGPHVYENQLQQIVTGDIKIEPNGVYANSTVEPITNQI